MWHPLTWLSLMLDRQFYGMNAGGYHWTNLLLHMANTLLLFFTMRRMTDAFWRSAFVAILFAVHPLHIESVAWISERKDVLCMFFWLLATWSYLQYIERLHLRWYLFTLFLFAAVSDGETYGGYVSLRSSPFRLLAALSLSTTWARHPKRYPPPARFSLFVFNDPHSLCSWKRDRSLSCLCSPRSSPFWLRKVVKPYSH